jgi:hypothetical protein
VDALCTAGAEAGAAGLVGDVEPVDDGTRAGLVAIDFIQARVAFVLAGKSSTTSTPARSKSATCAPIGPRSLAATRT